MAAFLFINAGTGLPLHVNGLGDKLASVRCGDCRDEFSEYWIEEVEGESTVYIMNVATGLPLHVNGLGDGFASVRCGDCRDSYSKYRLEAARGPHEFFIVNVATGVPLHIDGSGDKLASTRFGNIRDDFAKFRVEIRFTSKPCLLLNPGSQSPLHIDGLGDKLASVRFGNCRDAYSAFRIKAAETQGEFFLVNAGTSLPLHVDGLGDELASVRFADCWDDFCKFKINALDTIGEFSVISVATNRVLHINHSDDMLASVREGDIDEHSKRFRIVMYQNAKTQDEKRDRIALPPEYETVRDAPLGSGAFGVVWHCRHVSDGRECAVKSFHKPFLENEQLLRIELRNLEALPSHPNLVRYCTSRIDHHGKLHIVMEFVDSVKLSKLISSSGDSPSPKEHIFSWFQQLLKGLACMHSIRMVHRDLHAGNVLIAFDGKVVRTDSGSVKIIDVGLAKIYDNLEPAAMSIQGFGPAWYFSPERRRGEPFDDRDDVWAAGCMLAEMIVHKGCYIQKTTEHGPGGIDFSLKPACVANLLALCDCEFSSRGSTNKNGAEVPRLALAMDKAARARAGHLADQLN